MAQPSNISTNLQHFQLPLLPHTFSYRLNTVELLQFNFNAFLLLLFFGSFHIFASDISAEGIHTTFSTGSAVFYLFLSLVFCVEYPFSLSGCWWIWNWVYWYWQKMTKFVFISLIGCTVFHVALPLAWSAPHSDKRGHLGLLLEKHLTFLVGTVFSV